MDLSNLPDPQRQELEQLHKQFQQHQSQQPPPYDPFHAHQPYDPSHPQQHAFDQSSYYYNYQHPQHQYDPSFYHNYYPNSSYQQQQQPQDPYVSSGHPVNAGAGQPNLGYGVPPGIDPAAAAAAVAALSQLTQFAGGGHYDPRHFRPPVGHTPYMGGGRRGGGPFRGGSRGNSGFRPVSGPPFHGRGRERGRGRVRGRGRGGRRDPAIGAPSSHPESSAPANGQPPLRIAWCEVCRIDCTTNEVLDEHNKGKRHKRNLQKLQDKKCASQPVAQDATPGSEIVPEVDKNIPESEPDKQTEVGDDNNKKAETEVNDKQEKKPRMKRKMKGKIRGNRGGVKRMRPTGPRNRKVVIPLVCDLCNIKCDTQEVFDRHAAGKKHISKLKRFEGHQAMYGPTAVQALYPPNPLSQTLAPQPPPPAAVHYGASSSYPAPPEAYIPPPYHPENPNPQLADAPLEFGTQNAVLTG